MLVGRTRLLIAAGVVSLLLVGGVSYAAIGSGGTIAACYVKKTGLLRVIDVDAGATCARAEEPIAWNIQGPKGNQGDPGLKGDQGLPGLKGDQGEPGLGLESFDEFEGTTCNAGSEWAGTIALDYADDGSGAITMRCVPSNTTTSYSTSINCTSTGQLCSPPYEVTITTASLLRVEFTALELCGPARWHFSVDGALAYTSGLLSPTNNATGWVDLGPVSAGSHTISMQAEGAVGGCNTGRVGAWRGTLRVLTN